MSRMTDPTTALVSFQQALLDSEIQLMPATLDPALFVYMDQPNGHMRLTYVYLDNHTVIAFATYVIIEPLDGLPCFQAGVAVPENYRGRGLAKKVMAASIAEMKHGFSKTRAAAFVVEGIVSVTNEPSKRVSAQILSNTPEEVTDSFTGEAALRYVLKIGG